MLANDIGEFFVQKIENIRSELDLSASDSPNRVVDEAIALNACFDSFEQLSEEDVKNLIAVNQMGKLVHWIQCRLRLSYSVKMFFFLFLQG